MTNTSATVSGYINGKLLSSDFHELHLWVVDGLMYREDLLFAQLLHVAKYFASASPCAHPKSSTEETQKQIPIERTRN
jgi:hypothetical protein